MNRKPVLDEIVSALTCAPTDTSSQRLADLGAWVRNYIDPIYLPASRGARDTRRHLFGTLKRANASALRGVTNENSVFHSMNRFSVRMTATSAGLTLLTATDLKRQNAFAVDLAPSSPVVWHRALYENGDLGHAYDTMVRVLLDACWAPQPSDFNQGIQYAISNLMGATTSITSGHASSSRRKARCEGRLVSRSGWPCMPRTSFR